MKGYVAAVATTGAVALARYAARDVLGDPVSTLPFVVPVVVAAWVGGLRGALLATALGAAVYLFVSPYRSFALTDPREVVDPSLFVLVAVLVGGVCESLHAARGRAEAEVTRLNGELTGRVGELRALLAERGRAENALRESEGRFRALADDAPVLIWVNGPDGGVFVNRRYLEFVGAAPEQVGGMNWAQFLHPDDADGYVRAYREAFERRAPFEATFRFRRADDEYRWLRSSGVPRLTPAGEFLGYAGCSVDVTDVVRAEDDLRRQATIFENQTDAIIVTDLEGRILDWNPACERMLGYTKAEVLGRTTAMFHRPEDAPTLTRDALSTTERDGAWRGEITFVRKDGSLGVCDTVVKPLTDRSGAVVGAVGVNRDVTDRKRAEAAARAGEARRAFLLELSDALRPLGDPAEIEATALRTLGRHLGASRAYYVEVEPDEQHVVCATDYTDGVPSAAGRYRLADYSPALLGEYRAGRTVVIADAGTDPLVPDAARTAWAAIGIRAQVAVPLVKGGRFVAALGVDQARPRPWTADEVALVEATAERTWAAVERARAEGRLRDSEQRFRGIFDQAVAGIAETDLTGRFVRVNRRYCEIVGRTADELYALRMQDITHPDDLSRNLVLFGAALEGRGAFDIEKRYVRPDGSEVWVGNSVSVVTDDQGRPAHTVAVSVDITDRKRAEQELRASEERFRAFMDNSPAAAWITDTDGRFHFVSATYTRLFAFSAGGLVGRSVSDVYAAEFAEQYVANMRAVARTGEPLRAVERAPRPDGSVGEFLVYKFPLPGSALVGGVAVDVTDQRRAEEALRASERDARRQFAELSALYAHAPLGLGVFDRDLRYVRINPELAVINGLPAAAHIGRTVREVLPNLADAAEPLQRQVLATGRTVRTEFRGTTPAQPGVGRVWDTYWFPVPGPDGAPEAVAVIAQEITDRKRTEDALAEAARSLARERERLDVALRAARLGVYEWRVGESVVWWSPELYAVYGVDPAAFTPTLEAFTALIHPDDRAELWRKTEECLARREEFAHEYRVVRPDGSVRWVMNRSAVGLDAAGAVERITGVAADVTERHRAQEALQEADRRKDEFLATLAHELRNPLAPLRNGLQVMSLAGGDPRAVEKCRAVMERQVGQMARLIEDLMDLSRISRGKIALRKARIPVAVAIRNAVDTSRPLIDQMRHELTLDVPGEPIEVDADDTRLTQVFANLLNNAAKYTEPGGRIRLCAARQGGEAVVTVEDTGVGIPADMLTRVFEMFSQVDRSLERSQGGLGIGLHLVKRLVELHGGSVEARSGGHGAGSAFVVRLPVLAAATAEPRTEDAGPAPLARRRILVVDDNPDGAASLAEMLDLMGNETRTAHDGLEAVAVAEAFRPEVILMDIGMPKMNGFDACRLIRGEPWGRHAVIVAQTGWGQEDDRRKSREAGFDFHVVKPVDPTALQKLLAEARVPTG